MSAADCLLVLAFAAAAPCSGPAQSPQPPARQPVETLLERTLAIVGGAIIMQSDVELAMRLELLVPVPATEDDALSRLVDRRLMLHEAARFAPAEPEPSAVTARLASVRASAGTPAALTAILTRTGASPARLEAWIRDDLRIAAYLSQRFASPAAPTDADVDAALRSEDAASPRTGATASDARQAARERLIDERRRALIDDWLVDLRARTEVTLFK